MRQENIDALKAQIEETNRELLGYLPTEIRQRMPEGLDILEQSQWIQKHQAFAVVNRAGLRDIAINMGYLPEDTE